VGGKALRQPQAADALRADRARPQGAARSRRASRDAVAARQSKGERQMSKFPSWLIALAFAGFVAAFGATQGTAQRFDYLVREDMFRGFAGDKAAFDRAMALCEARLAENPDHPEALVWHGTGLLFRSGEAFRSGDSEKATLLNRNGLAEMKRAVALAPNSLSVRIPRGAVLLAAAIQIADAQRARPYFETAVDDFEKAFA